MTTQSNAPIVGIDTPEGWVFDETPETWAVVRGPDIEGFTPNVVVVVLRVSSELGIEALAGLTLEGMTERYSDVDVREVRTSDAVVDRSVSFVTEGKHLVQYQRLLLLPSVTDRVHWFVQTQATTLLDHEADYRAIFSSVMSSVTYA
jgi:hypothetical protein